MRSLYFAHYNFCWIRKSLRVTPAIETGLADGRRDIELLGFIGGMVQRIVRTKF